MSRIRRLARELGVICAVILLLAVAAFAAQRLLFPGRAASLDIPQTLDDALGPIMKEQIRATAAVVDDREVSSAFSAIMGRLLPAIPASAVEDRRITVDVLVINSPEINAFTLPGRVICVDAGLIRELKSAEEMAAVLGHELSHVVHRDPLALLGRQIGMATLANVVTGGQGAAVLERIIQTMVNVHYGREAEDRADAFSVHLLARAGIPPVSFSAALARIRDSARKEPGLLKYIDPHSPIDRRIENAREQAGKEQVVPRNLPVDWEKIKQVLSPA
ncbi:MAG: M48 family metallopeptidase [Spirochaetia bacterium]